MAKSDLPIQNTPIDPEVIPREYLDYLAAEWTKPALLTNDMVTNPDAAEDLPPLLPERSGSAYYFLLPQFDFVTFWVHQGLTDEDYFIAKPGLHDFEVNRHLRAIMNLNSVEINHRIEAVVWLMKMWVEEVFYKGTLWFAAKDYLLPHPVNTVSNPLTEG